MPFNQLEVGFCNFVSVSIVVNGGGSFLAAKHRLGLERSRETGLKGELSRERVNQLKGSVKNGESEKDGIFHLKIEGSRGSVQGSQ